jgi:hypothetical protein
MAAERTGFKAVLLVISGLIPQGVFAECAELRGRGAAVTYLSHNASSHSKEQIAPSSRGIKHLVIKNVT